MASASGFAQNCRNWPDSTTIPWNPLVGTELSANDDTFATVGLESVINSNQLQAFKYQFSIPGATIDGIEVKIRRKANLALTIKDNSVYLMREGRAYGDNKADTVTTYGTSEAEITYGSSTDTWGQTWKAGDFNNLEFGVIFVASCYDHTPGDTGVSVDSIEVVVYYTVLTAGSSGGLVIGSETSFIGAAYIGSPETSAPPDDGGIGPLVSGRLATGFLLVSGRLAR